jgi:YD repeat-containing protein
MADKVFDRLKLNKAGAPRNAVSRAICTVTGHPVDVASGKLFTDFVDLELRGPLPFKLERVWYSTSTYEGPLGHGWHASFDMALVEDEEVVGIRLGDGRMALFPALKPNDWHFNRDERLTLYHDRGGYRLCSAASGITHLFAHVRGLDKLPLVAVEDRSGHTVRFRYDDRARLRQIVDAGGRTWDLVYGPDSSRISELIGPDPNASTERIVYVRYFYDGRGNLCEVRDALDQPQRFSYKRHLLAQETNRNGLSFYFEYDGRDHHARCVRTWGDDGIYDHTLTYDVDRKLTTVENSLGHKTQYEHDGSMVRRTIDAFGNTRSAKYGDGYCVLENVDELGQKTEYAYDDRGNLTMSVGPDRATMVMTYDDNDLLVSAIDVLSGKWTWTRDDKGRLVNKTDPLGRITKYEYQGTWLVGVVGPAGARTTLSYGQTGDLDLVANADGGLTHLRYDALGRLIGTKDAEGSVRLRVLDVLGRVVRIHEPDGDVREFAYDGEGNVVHARDRLHDVRFVYRGMNRLASRSEAGTSVSFLYDTEEQLTSIVNEHGAVYRFVLGPTGQVDEEHGFDGLMRKYRRDAAGRVLRIDRPGTRFSSCWSRTLRTARLATLTTPRATWSRSASQTGACGATRGTRPACSARSPDLTAAWSRLPTTRSEGASARPTAGRPRAGSGTATCRCTSGSRATSSAWVTRAARPGRRSTRSRRSVMPSSRSSWHRARRLAGLLRGRSPGCSSRRTLRRWRGFAAAMCCRSCATTLARLRSWWMVTVGVFGVLGSALGISSWPKTATCTRSQRTARAREPPRSTCSPPAAGTRASCCRRAPR